MTHTAVPAPTLADALRVLIEREEAAQVAYREATEARRAYAAQSTRAADVLAAHQTRHQRASARLAEAEQAVAAVMRLQV